MAHYNFAPIRTLFYTLFEDDTVRGMENIYRAIARGSVNVRTSDRRFTVTYIVWPYSKHYVYESVYVLLCEWMNLIHKRN